MRVQDRLGGFGEVAEPHPDAVETAPRRERSVWWGWGPRKVREGCAHVVPHRGHVNLGSFQGVSLPDPDGLIEGTGLALRHVELRAPDDVAGPAVRALLEAARDERRAALGPV